jgi:DNA-binding NarL/FixJ family response regulator
VSLPCRHFAREHADCSAWPNSSFQVFCDCIERLHRGETFASNQQLGYLLDSVCQVPSLRVVSANGEKLLTSREEQVVALVADGLSNRDVATELGLSELTVKKYLFRIFEKLGISSRGAGPLCPSSWNSAAAELGERKLARALLSSSPELNCGRFVIQ